MNTIEVRMADDIPETLTISYIDIYHFRASLVGGFNKTGHVYHIREAENESYYEEVRTFLIERSK